MTHDPHKHDLAETTGILKRRNALKKSIGAGGVLAAAIWSKPIVESVVLPAHAQTSELDAPLDPQPPGEAGCPDGLSPTARFNIGIEDLNNACSLIANPTTLTSTTQSSLYLYDNTFEQLNPPLHVANLNLIDITADFGDFEGDITRTVVFSNFDDSEIDMEEALDPPPVDETVTANGGGPVSFANVTIPMKHTVAGSEDWRVDINVRFTSACGSTEINLRLNFNEQSDPNIPC